jgi:hypothetical protein
MILTLVTIVYRRYQNERQISRSTSGRTRRVNHHPSQLPIRGTL